MAALLTKRQKFKRPSAACIVPEHSPKRCRSLSPQSLQLGAERQAAWATPRITGANIPYQIIKQDSKRSACTPLHRLRTASLRRLAEEAAAAQSSDVLLRCIIARAIVRTAPSLLIHPYRSPTGQLLYEPGDMMRMRTFIEMPAHSAALAQLRRKNALRRQSHSDEIKRIAATKQKDMSSQHPYQKLPPRHPRSMGQRLSIATFYLKTISTPQPPILFSKQGLLTRKPSAWLTRMRQQKRNDLVENAPKALQPKEGMKGPAVH